MYKNVLLICLALSSASPSPELSFDSDGAISPTAVPISKECWREIEKSLETVIRVPIKQANNKTAIYEELIRWIDFSPCKLVPIRLFFTTYADEINSAEAIANAGIPHLYELPERDSWNY